MFLYFSFKFFVLKPFNNLHKRFIVVIIGFNSKEYILDYYKKKNSKEYIYNFFVSIRCVLGYNSHPKFPSHSIHNMNWKTYYN